MYIEPHVNVVCTYCRRIVDLYSHTLEVLLGLVAALSGYDIDPSIGAIVYGRCAECQRATIDSDRNHTTSHSHGDPPNSKPHADPLPPTFNGCQNDSLAGSAPNWPIRTVAINKGR